MAEEEAWERPFKQALEAVRRGRFDEVKDSLEALGFEFRATKDPNHWLYFHAQLRDDRHFGYPRNLYRPHGHARSAERISKHDQSQARQMIEALRGVVGFLRECSGEEQ